MLRRERGLLGATALLLLPSIVPAQSWSEVSDAPSFPDLAAQGTRGEGALSRIVGATQGVDLRDAYCIKITDPEAFRATTDASVDTSASADFDTRLFLFDDRGAPLLANDDSAPGAPPFHSTLNGEATDGSLATLPGPGDYVLVVSGSSETPLDSSAEELFAFTNGLGLVHGPDPGAGRFASWEADAPAVGTYTVALRGVEACQVDLDLVLGKENTSDRICRGNGRGGFSSCADPSPDSFASGIFGQATGYLDDDPHLDLVSTRIDGTIRRCLGDGKGGFAQCSGVPGSSGALDVELARIDGDPHLDAVVFDASALGLCPGDGSGGFGACTDVAATGLLSRGALGFVDGDEHLDAVATDSLNQNAQICLGDGAGAFDCALLDDAVLTLAGLALGDVNGDTALDAIFANGAGEGSALVCLGDGTGAFDCDAANLEADESRAVALADLDGDAVLDAVFANDGTNRVCRGDGTGAFARCAPVSDDANDSADVALGWIDDDDALDAVFANGSGQPDRVCFGDGGGGFVGCADVGAGTVLSHDVVLGEFGRDTLFEDGFASGDVCGWGSAVGSDDLCEPSA